MTRPPDDRWDPNRETPETRQFGPSDDTAAHGQQQHPDPYQQPGYQEPYAPDPYATPQAYTEATQAYGQSGYEQQDPGYGDEPPQPPAKHTGRTVGLALAAIAALIVLILLVVLVTRDNGDGSDEPAAGAASSTTTTAQRSEPTTTTTTTEDTTTTTTRTARPGAVVYQLTGNGDVVAIRFRDGDQHTFVAAAGSPWSQAATVSGGRADMTAIVVRGPVTCTILHNGELLSSSTSNGGPLSCSAPVPND
ncbi:hypothetical protein AAFP35_01110 [Gordonia sp. CPCC 206044]|uniref:hypothetical protein n=1 Tax=Gordonia sp. CPCC 206044 TaxID=3140793 RepID=UPI003AF3F488